MTQFYTENPPGNWFLVDTDAGTRTPVDGPGDSPAVGGVFMPEEVAISDHGYVPPPPPQVVVEDPVFLPPVDGPSLGDTDRPVYELPDGYTPVFSFLPPFIEDWWDSFLGKDGEPHPSPGETIDKIVPNLDLGEIGKWSTVAIVAVGVIALAPTINTYGARRR